MHETRDPSGGSSRDHRTQSAHGLMQIDLFILGLSLPGKHKLMDGINSDSKIKLHNYYVPFDMHQLGHPVPGSISD